MQTGYLLRSKGSHKNFKNTYFVIHVKSRLTLVVSRQFFNIKYFWPNLGYTYILVVGLI